MLTHLTEPLNVTTTLLQKEDFYYCPECLIHFAVPQKWCWFCGVKYGNYPSLKTVYPREKEN